MASWRATFSPSLYWVQACHIPLARETKANSLQGGTALQDLTGRSQEISPFTPLPFEPDSFGLSLCPPGGHCFPRPKQGSGERTRGLTICGGGGGEERRYTSSS